MINEKDIKHAIAQMLKDKGFNVVATEVEEGFKKPAVFVSVYPAKCTRSGPLLEEITDSIEIKYIPTAETEENCLNVIEELKRIFFYETLNVKDRKITVDEIEFNVEKYILYAYFDITYMQEVPSKDDDENHMEFLELGGDI